jgi:hypothetical protein
MFDKNDFSMFIQRHPEKKLNEIVEDFIEKRKLKINSEIDLTDNSEYHNNSSKQTKNLIKEKFRDCTSSFYPNRTSRLNLKEKRMNKNIDIFDYKFQDVETNNQIINFLPQFKKMYKYNKKIQSLFSREENQSFSLNPNRVDILKKIEEFKTILKETKK